MGVLGAVRGLDVICLPEDNDDVVWVQLEIC